MIKEHKISVMQARELKSLVLCACMLLGASFYSEAQAQGKAAERLAEISVKKARVQQVVAQLDTRIRLTRSRDEFIEDVGLFDNRLYGKVGSHSNQEKIDELNGRIDAKNEQLNQMLNNPPPSPTGSQEWLGDDDRGNTFSDDYFSQIKQLGTDISSLKDDLNSLSSETASLDGGTEILDGAIWLDEEDRLSPSLAGDRAEEQMELYTGILEKLKTEEKRLTLELEAETEKEIEK